MLNILEMRSKTFLTQSFIYLFADFEQNSNFKIMVEIDNIYKVTLDTFKICLSSQIYVSSEIWLSKAVFLHDDDVLIRSFKLVRNPLQAKQ